MCRSCINTANGARFAISCPSSGAITSTTGEKTPLTGCVLYADRGGKMYNHKIPYKATGRQSFLRGIVCSTKMTQIIDITVKSFDEAT